MPSRGIMGPKASVGLSCWLPCFSELHKETDLHNDLNYFSALTFSNILKCATFIFQKSALLFFPDNHAAQLFWFLSIPPAVFNLHLFAYERAKPISFCQRIFYWVPMFLNCRLYLLEIIENWNGIVSLHFKDS